MSATLSGCNVQVVGSSPTVGSTRNAEMKRRRAVTLGAAFALLALTTPTASPMLSRRCSVTLFSPAREDLGLWERLAILLGPHDERVEARNIRPCRTQTTACEQQGTRS